MGVCGYPKQSIKHSQPQVSKIGRKIYDETYSVRVFDSFEECKTWRVSDERRFPETVFNVASGYAGAELGRINTNGQQCQAGCLDTQAAVCNIAMTTLSTHFPRLVVSERVDLYSAQSLKTPNALDALVTRDVVCFKLTPKHSLCCSLDPG